MNQQPQTGQPSCFGMSWDASSVECRGGNDPCYTHPGNGGNRREMCSWYTACSAATNRAKAVQAAQSAPRPPANYGIVQPTNLVRLPVVQAPPPPAQIKAPQMTISHQVVPQQVPQQVVQHGGAYCTQPEHAYQPALVPINQPMPGGSIPSFLTVPEPTNPCTPPGVVLARTVLRSVVKAAAMACANFIDYNPIGAGVTAESE